MISGFNTDVDHDGTVFHVQTEDKGRANPVIESLVFVGGQVVVSKRDEYAEMLEEGADDRQIAARMDHQHKLMIAAIRSGRFDRQLEAVLEGDEEAALPESADSSRVRDALAGIGGAHASETSVTLHHRAVALGDELEGDPTLDEMVLRYLQNDSTREHLVLALEENGDLQLGRKAFLALRASSSRSGTAVAGADVSVRLISTLREPELLGEGVTDEDGECFLNVQVPAFGTGSAALIISASSDIGKAELKHLL